jgi:hypothetical protein
MSNGGAITLRLAVAGAPEVKAALASLGPVGAQAMRQIEQAQRSPSDGMKALNSIAVDARKGLNGIVEEAGTAGRALEHFGAAGIAAAAAIGAAMVAGEKLFEATRQAMEYGEALETAAVAAGVSTEALQKYRYAAEQSGIATQAADESLRKFTQSFGLAKEGSQRQLKFFDLLFTPEEMRQFKTVDEALDATVEKISELPDAAERAAIAKRLGLEALIPLLQTNKEHIAELRNEAQRLGVVMDEQTVKALAEAEKKFKSASDVINTQFKAAVVGLTPILVGMIQKIAEMVRGLDEFLARFRGVEAQSDAQIAARISELRAQAPGTGHWETQARGGGHSSATVWVQNPAERMIPSNGGHGPLVSSDKARQDELAQLTVLQIQRAVDRTKEQAAAAANLKATGSDFVADSKGGRQGPDEAKLAQERAKAGNDAVASAQGAMLAAQKEELQAQLQSATSAEDRLRIQEQLIDLELDAQRTALDKKQADLDSLLAQKKISQSAYDEASFYNDLAIIQQQTNEVAKKELAQREAALKRAEEDQTRHATSQQNELDALRAQQAIALTMAERARLAREIFDLEEKTAEDALKAQIAEAKIAGDKARQADLEDHLAGMQATASDRRTAVERANPSSPWEKWRTDALAATADVNAAFQQITVDGLDQFNQSLFDSEGRLNSLGDIAKSVFTRMLVDLEQYLLKQDEIGMFGGGSGGGGFLGSLFGGFGSVLGSGGSGGVFDGGGWDFPALAGGGRVTGPGSGTSDSIFAALSNGEFVVNAKATQRFLPMLTAMNENRPMPIPRFAAGGMVGGQPAGGAAFGGVALTIHAPAYFNAPGADPAALQRLQNAHADWQKGEPQRFLGYIRAAGLTR